MFNLKLFKREKRGILKLWKHIRHRTSHVLYLLSISLLQNIAYTLFDTTGEIKGPLLYFLDLIFMAAQSEVSSARTHIAERRSSVA